MIKAIKIKLYPTFKQQEMLDEHFNGCRFIYNSALNYKIALYNDYKINKSKIDIINELPDVKEEFIWLKKIKAEVLQNTIDNLDKAFKNFFNGSGYPKFKSKKHKQSFTSTQNFRILENSNKIVFLKHKIKFKCSKRDAHLIRNSKIKRITYSKNNLNDYYASVLIETNEHKKYGFTDNEVGVDLGIKNFLITSNGEIFENPRFLKKSENKLKKQQRFLSKKSKGSKNYKKQRIKLAKIHKKIQNQRNHFLHDVSNKLISENQTIFIETLRISNMIKNHKLAKAISDVSWGNFVLMLQYKAKWHNKNVINIGTFEPSSKTCYNCGHINQNITLNDRVFICPICNYNEDRDINAAKNIEKIGRNHPEFKLVEKNVGFSMNREETLSI